MHSMRLSPSALLVHEYVVGGGWPEPELPQPLGGEALALLSAVVEDLRAWGGLPIVTTCDRRLPLGAVQADRVVPLSPQVYPGGLIDVARSCGAALLIAPEGGRVLECVTRDLAAAGVHVLGSAPGAVARAADKWQLYGLLHAAGLPVPATRLVAPPKVLAVAQEIAYPVIVKPRSGAGCERVCLVQDAAEWTRALHVCEPSREDLLVQEYVAGTAASVSLLVADGAASVLGMNEQRMHFGIPCEYTGGVAGIAHERREEAFSLARQAVSLLPGLRGYVGVDMVVSDSGCQLIEVNPRLTTSYIGLREALSIDLGEALWRACVDGVLPPDASPQHPVPFQKAGPW